MTLLRPAAYLAVVTPRRQRIKQPCVKSRIGDDRQQGAGGSSNSYPPGAAIVRQSSGRSMVKETDLAERAELEERAFDTPIHRMARDGAWSGAYLGLEKCLTWRAAA